MRTLLAETLLTHCNMRVAAEVVAEALANAKLLEVPEEQTPFVRFVRLYVRDALQRQFGMDTSESVVEEIERVLAVEHSSGTYSRHSLGKVNVVRKTAAD